MFSRSGGNSSGWTSGTVAVHVGVPAMLLPQEAGSKSSLQIPGDVGTGRGLALAVAAGLIKLWVA